MTTTRALTFLLALSVGARVDGGLLEMSQTLWAKLISGGLAKVGQLDPLRVPVIKVDQSEGNTSYRIVLRNLEILGLNDSVVESVRLARGALRSNLSELEAGYVSYSDLRGLDSVRYRFHTLLKRPANPEPSQRRHDETFARDNRFERLRMYEPQAARTQNSPQQDPYAGQRDRQHLQDRPTNQYQYPEERFDQRQHGRQRSQHDKTGQYDSQFSEEQARQQQQSRHQQLSGQQDRQYQLSRHQEYSGEQGRRYQHSQSEQYSGQEREYRQYPQNGQSSGTGRFDYQRPETQQVRQRPTGIKFSRIQQSPRELSEGEQFERTRQAAEDSYYSKMQTSSETYREKQRTTGKLAESSYETTERTRTTPGQRNYADGYQGFRAHVDPVSGSVVMRASRVRTPMASRKSADLKGKEEVDSSDVGSRYPANVDVVYAETGSGSSGDANDGRAESEVECFGKQDEGEGYAEFEEFVVDAQEAASEGVESETPGQAGTRMESPPGYIDIVYADGKQRNGVKHFGNLRIDPRQDKQVYDLGDVVEDIRNSRQFLVYNLTKGESLSRRNEAMKAALDGKNLKNLTRYAENYQEKQGYFEEGMQLIYHFGNQRKKDDSAGASEAIRKKRAHLDDEVEDDLMHVVLRIRVPMLRVKSHYLLMGKVGQEVLRGSGLLSGNFTDLVGDFTVELKKTGEELMIVRAARAKLVAKDKQIALQGMDDKGPVQSILNYGLMAAEAVAAMLADDLATKALSEKTADAIIYKMYKDLPPN